MVQIKSFMIFFHVYIHYCNLNYVISFFFQQIPTINEVFAELNKTVKDTTVLSDEAKKSVNDSLDAGVREINYTQYKEQVWTFKSYLHV